MKTEKQFEKWIESQIKFYQPYLALHLQRIRFEKSKDEKADFSMEITVTYPYYDPTIRYTKIGFDDWKIGKMKPDRVLHELCHILTDPLYVKATKRWTSHDEIIDERERLTDKIALIIRNLLKNDNS